MPPMIMPTLTKAKQLEERREGPWMRTYTGRRFYPADPRPEDVHLLDIVQGLIHEPRFAGQCQEPFSVAQHSCMVMARTEQLCILREIVGENRKDLLRWALMHDATEAYLKDIPGPFKRLIPEYRAYELKAMGAIAAKFDLHQERGYHPGRIPDLVKQADRELCITEAFVLYGADGISDWGWDSEPLPTDNQVTKTLLAKPWSPDDARSMFNRAFVELWELA